MLPSVTNVNQIEPRKSGEFDAYVTFCALGGMICDDVGNISFMSVNQFCEQYNVSRMTLSRWKRETPDWGEIVRARRDEIIPWARETAALNRMFTIGMTSLPAGFDTVEVKRIDKQGNITITTKKVPRGALHDDQRAAVDALKTYTGHHSKLRLPTQPIEHEVGGGVADLLNMARKRREQAIEGTVVEQPNTDS